jgi:lactose/L-arabinose transport system permease protein
LKGGVPVNSKKKGMTLVAKQRAAGWLFLAPASIMIAVMSFYPMIRAFIISLQTGAGANMRFAEPIFSNYKRIMADKVFQQSIANTFLYLIIQVPIMLVLAILLAQLLNNKDLKFRGFFRTCVFLPCATSLVSYSLIFRSMFATDGLINSILIKLGILSTGYNFLGNSTSAKIVIILALIWRWTGYNMVFYLAGLQNIEYSVYEAAKIDGANAVQTFFKITLPYMLFVMTPYLITQFTGNINNFNVIFLLSGGNPTPVDATAGKTDLLVTWLYKLTVDKNYYNLGAVIGIMTFIVLAIVALVTYRNTASYKDEEGFM